MEEILRELLNRLEQIGSDHEDLYDTECRERLSIAVINGFVRRQSEFTLADDFGLHVAEANHAVETALTEYIANANAKAAELEITGFRERLNAFQNSNVESVGEGSCYDDFFGHSAPGAFDPAGDVNSRL